MRTSDGASPRSESAWATGASLMASGLVPMTRQIRAELSLPPNSAGALCLQSVMETSLSERTSAKRKLSA